MARDIRSQRGEKRSEVLLGWRTSLETSCGPPEVIRSWRRENSAPDIAVTPQARTPERQPQESWAPQVTKEDSAAENMTETQVQEKMFRESKRVRKRKCVKRLRRLSYNGQLEQARSRNDWLSTFDSLVWTDLTIALFFSKLVRDVVYETCRSQYTPWMRESVVSHAQACARVSLFVFVFLLFYIPPWLVSLFHGDNPLWSPWVCGPMEH